MLSPKEILLAWHKAFVSHDLEALCALYAEDAVNHQVAEEALYGKDSIRESFIGFFKAFPNEETEILNVFEDGDWAMWEWRGWDRRLKRENPQMPDFHGCGFFQVKDGKITLQRGYWDKLTFLKNHNLPSPL